MREPAPHLVTDTPVPLHGVDLNVAICITQAEEELSGAEAL
jgi:hypothetical protein